MTNTTREITSRLSEFLSEQKARITPAAGFDRTIIADLHRIGVYRTFIPAACGGCFSNYEEGLELVRETAWHSLELSLAIGITASLFLHPISRHAPLETQKEIFDDYLARGCVGGMAATEPGFGTDMTNLATSFKREGDGYRIRGVKQWQGLTNWAQYWLVIARKERDNGPGLSREIDFFVVRSDMPGFKVLEMFPTSGLLGITYGRTSFDVQVPLRWKLCGESSNMRIFFDVLNRSRTSISAIAAGACRRLVDEMKPYLADRRVFGKALVDYEQVQYRYANLQAIADINEWLCRYAGNMMDEAKDGFLEMLAANIIKTTTSDLMQDACQSALQLNGANGFRRDSYVGKAFVDSRPFQIFEGSNDVLYDAISGQLLGEARRKGFKTVGECLAAFPATPLPRLPDDPVRDMLLPESPSQAGNVLLGRMISRYASIGMIQKIAAQRGTPVEADSPVVTYLLDDCERCRLELPAIARFLARRAPAPA